jgi:S1-C subfamily serine protease
MSCHRTTIAIGVCGFVSAAVLVFVGTRPSPRLEGAEPSAGSPEAKKSVPDLVVELSHAIVRLDVWRPYQLKDPNSGQETAGCTWSAGTGFVVRCERLGGNDTTDDVEFDVVTNAHVIAADDAQRDWTAPSKLQCSMYGVNVTNTSILGRDTLADLAVVRVRAQAPKDRVPKALPWADPNGIRVGEDVVAIGYGYDITGRPTVTRGIVGATRRALPADGDQQAVNADLVQHDAPINRGNSGGPLVNLRGEVVGVNTYLLGAAVSKDDQNNISVDVPQGMYFSRSCRTAKPFAERIVSAGTVARLDLGSSLLSVVEPRVRMFGWPQCVYVQTTPAGSLAAKVGLQPGDLIVAVGSAPQRPAASDPSQETKINSVGELNDALGLRGGDATIWVRLIRPPAALIAAVNNSQYTAYVNGDTYVAYLR